MMNVLFLNCDFFEFDRAIAKMLRIMNYKVDSYCYVKEAGFLDIKMANREGKRAIDVSIKRQQKRVLKRVDKAGGEYDVVLVTAGQALLLESLEHLKRRLPKALFVWYLWDGTDNIPLFEEQKKYYDVFISFDKVFLAIKQGIFKGFIRNYRQIPTF